MYNAMEFESNLYILGNSTYNRFIEIFPVNSAYVLPTLCDIFSLESIWAINTVEDINISKWYFSSETLVCAPNTNIHNQLQQLSGLEELFKKRLRIPDRNLQLWFCYKMKLC